MDLGRFSLTGPREANEDNCYVQDLSKMGSFPRDIRAYIMVSDGMGGYQGGDVASSLAVESAEKYLPQLAQLVQNGMVDIDPLAAMAEIVQRAHTCIKYKAQERGGVNMGATYVGAFISSTHAWIGHVGDSRAYLIRDGEAIQITEDHSQVGRMLSRGVITEEEAQNHPNRNRIERALGFPNYEIEFDEVELRAGDALLLCSDGVYTAVKGAVLAECVDEMGSAQEAAQEIANEAIACGTDDNSTVVVAMGFAGPRGDTDPNLPVVVPNTEITQPESGPKQAMRTLTDFDGVAPIRDEDPIPMDAAFAPRSSQGERRRRQRSGTDAYARDRYTSSRRGADDRQSTRSRGSSQRRRSSQEAQGQGGRTRKYDAQNSGRSSRSRRSSESRGSGSRAGKGGIVSQSSLDWRTMLIFGIVIVAVAIISFFLGSATAGMKSADEPASNVAAGVSATQDAGGGAGDLNAPGTQQPRVPNNAIPVSDGDDASEPGDSGSTGGISSVDPNDN